MNHGEDAYEAGFYMAIPPGLDYKRVEKVGDLKEVVPTCTPPNADNNNVLKCDLGNPFPGGRVAKFRVVFNPAQKNGMAPSFDFYMEANSTNAEKERTSLDNIYKKTISIWVETDLVIKGNSYPQEFHYNLTQYVDIENATTEQEIGPQVVHIYDVSNIGPSAIEEAEIYVIWPYETLEGDDLMYMLTPPETSGNIRCEDHISINSRGLKIDQKLKEKGVLMEFTGVAAQGSSHGFAHKQGDGSVSKVAFEKSSSSSSGSSSGSRSQGSGSASGGRVNVKLTAEDERRLEAEEKLESTGDASEVHRRRQQETHLGGGGGASGNYKQSSSSSWSSQTGSQGQSPVTYTRSQNKSSYTGADGNTRTFETSTEYATIQKAHFGGVSSSSSSGNYRQGSAVNRPGTYKIPDIQTEEVINHDLNAGAHRGGAVRITNANTIEATTKATGRRRIINNEDGYSSGATHMEKVAQGGHGFQAASMDLGAINRQSTSGNRAGTTAGGSSSYHSQSTGGSTGGYSGGKFQYGAAAPTHHYSGSTGVGQSGHSSSGHAQSSFHSVPVPHDNNDHEEGDDDYSLDNNYDDYTENDQDNTQQHPHPTQQYQQQYNHQPVTHGGLNHQQPQHGDKLQHYRRFKRSVLSDESDHELMKELSTCNATKCAILKCHAGPLVNDARAFIALRTRLVAYTLDKNTLSVPLNISSKVVARIVKLPYIGEPEEKPLKTFEVPVKAIPEPIIAPDVVPLWVVVLSAVAGTLILLLLIYLLYKVSKGIANSIENILNILLFLFF